MHRGIPHGAYLYFRHKAESMVVTERDAHVARSDNIADELISDSGETGRGD